MAKVLIPLPSRDFDPTEAAVPWSLLRERGHAVLFATPDGAPAQADDRMVSGRGLGPLAPFLRADANGRKAYAAMTASPEFREPLRYDVLQTDAFDALLLPGGHAPGMKPYLESSQLQSLIATQFERAKPVGAICHGVVLASRAKRADGRSVLHGKRTTALPRSMEMTAWHLTRAWLGDYYRTYPTTVEDEVTAALARPDDFEQGPNSLLRDDASHLSRGFTVRDGHYLSARWPGDAHRFAMEFAELL